MTNKELNNEKQSFDTVENIIETIEKQDLSIEEVKKEPKEIFENIKDIEDINLLQKSINKQIGELLKRNRIEKNIRLGAISNCKGIEISENQYKNYESGEVDFKTSLIYYCCKALKLKEIEIDIFKFKIKEINEYINNINSNNINSEIGQIIRKHRQNKFLKVLEVVKHPKLLMSERQFGQYENGAAIPPSKLYIICRILGINSINTSMLTIIIKGSNEELEDNEELVLENMNNNVSNNIDIQSHNISTMLNEEILIELRQLNYILKSIEKKLEEKR